MSDLLVDTNILLAVLDPRHPLWKQTVDLIRGFRLTNRLVLPPQALYEAYVVLTRPVSVNGRGLSTQDAYMQITSAQTQFTFLPDPPNLLDEWLELCRTHEVSGKTAHDARLAAYARLNNIQTLITLNPRDFSRYGLNVVVP